MRAVLVLVAALALVGCPPTLSKPESAAHRDALAEGDRHAGHGRDEEAADAYGRAADEADRRVDRDEALYRQSRAEVDAGHPERAIELLMQIVNTHPPSRRTPRALFDAGRLKYELGDADGAIALFRRVTLEFPSEGPAARGLVWWLRHFEENDQVDRALAVLDWLLPQVRRSKLGDDILAHEARLRFAQDDREGARAALERTVRDYPYPYGHRWDDATLQLAEMDVEDGEYRRAIARLEAMLERSEGTSMVGSYTLPAFAEALMQIAKIQRVHLRDRDAADAAYEAVYDEYETSLLRDDALVERGEMWLDAGDRERGCDYLREAVDEFEVGSARRRAAARLEADCGG